MKKIDYVKEGKRVDFRLLRSLVLGGRHSNEIQLLLDSQAAGKPNYQALALTLANHSVNEDVAQETFVSLRNHQNRLQKILKRPIGIKTAASDYLENIENALGLQEEEQPFTYSQLAQMAFTDSLTGLANYRSFMSHFIEEMRKAERYHRQLSLVMLDIDYFKLFNDKFGHPGGNLALQFLAATLRSEVRETDVVGRYGGEEFAIVLHETPEWEAMEMAERIRIKIANTPVVIDEQSQFFTISLGVATYPRDAHNAQELLIAADEALYTSKQRGRNRVSVYQPNTYAEISYLPPDAESVKSVCVEGDFNGWDKQADLMTKGKDGYYRIRLALVPGRYVYKFVINDDVHIQDPLCLETITDNFGGKNSVLSVKA